MTVGIPVFVAFRDKVGISSEVLVQGNCSQTEDPYNVPK